MGVLGCQKIKSSGEVMNCPEKKKYFKIFKTPVGGGSFRGSKNQNSGKCQELPRTSPFFFKPRWEGVDVLGGQTIKSPGNVMNCRKNRYIFCNPPPRMERGRGRREGGDREAEMEREAGREGGARAKPGNQLVINKFV